MGVLGNKGKMVFPGVMGDAARTVGIGRFVKFNIKNRFWTIFFPEKGIEFISFNIDQGIVRPAEDFFDDMLQVVFDINELSFSRQGRGDMDERGPRVLFYQAVH